MTNSQKSISILGIIVLLGVLYGAYQYPKQAAVTQGVSSAGATNRTARVLSVTVAPSTASATTTSVQNTFGTDVAIQSTFAVCSGVGTSQAFLTGAGLTSNGWTLQAATTSVANTGLQGNTANLAMNVAISTTTSNSYNASSTEPFPNPVSRIIPAGAYLTFQFNATNTAACTVGANVINL